MTSMDTGKLQAVSSGEFDPIHLCHEIKSEKMVRLPCRARGVCDTHTPTTAYFEMPEDCPHGRLLICSHKKCADSGRIFRYCKICDQVTAKRNFSKRHAHGVYDRSSPVASADQASVESSETKKRKVSYDHEGIQGDSFVNLLMSAIGGDEDSSTDNDETSTDMSRVATTSNMESKVLIMMTREEARLFDLVRSRPRDRNDTKQWIDEILALTDDKIMEEAILTDDEEELEFGSRMPSLDRFDVLFESFDRLLMD